MSSEDGFFDIIHLGIFIILSLAFDGRFYMTKPPHDVAEEAAFATLHFHSLLQIFSQRFFILLEGEVVAPSYVFHRMLGEFAAAAVVFAKAIRESQEATDDGNGEDKATDDGNGEDGVTPPPTTIPPAGKRHNRAGSVDDGDEQRKKRRA